MNILYNDAVNTSGNQTVANTNRDTAGKAIITNNLGAFMGRDFTVENIQNARVHEYGGHFLAGFPGGYSWEHALAITLQVQHSTWKNVTPAYSANIKGVFKDITGEKLKD